ncbi:hypothetical protein [Sphingobium yanoikuyae]|uniref:hypothetical protein n=1 Tax=Sphingobium yanoikuyae TaxID=13690 RepID=UPI002431867D|nr:hypothetical protein [Sphingobium yanoikuyae]
MADSFASASFEFSCSTEEMALLDEAFAAAESLACDFEPINPTPAFLAAFPATKDGDPFSGLLALFDDPQFPIIGAELASGLPPDEPGQCPIHIFGTTEFEPRPLASIIQRCCQETLRKAPITFEWAYTSTPARVGEFGGGRCAIFTDRIDIETTAEALRKLVDGKAATPREDGSGAEADAPVGVVQVARALVLNAPEIFADAAFLRWLEAPAAKFSWHRGGQPDEWSDVIVLVDPSLTGEGSDSDMPQHIWDRIVALCEANLPREPGMPHIMVRLTNLEI